MEVMRNKKRLQFSILENVTSLVSLIVNTLHFDIYVKPIPRVNFLFRSNILTCRPVLTVLAASEICFTSYLYRVSGVSV